MVQKQVLVKPIQDQVFTAVQDIAEAKKQLEDSIRLMDCFTIISPIVSKIGDGHYRYQFDSLAENLYCDRHLGCTDRRRADSGGSELHTGWRHVANHYSLRLYTFGHRHRLDGQFDVAGSEGK